MPAVYHCPHCHQPVTVPNELLGQNIACPICGGVFNAPLPRARAVPAPPPADPFDFSSPDGAPPRAEGPAGHLYRRYRHTKCGCIMVATGDSYVMMENPFRPVSALCSRCGRQFELTEFVWDDSGENIGCYRDRIYNSVSFKDRMYYISLGNGYEGAIRLKLDKHGHRRLDDDD